MAQRDDQVGLKEASGTNPGGSRKVRRWLNVARWCALVMAVLLGVIGPIWGVPLALASFSPLVGLSSVVAAPGAAGWWVAAGLLLLPLIVWRRRWFCRWVCPTGFLLDGCRRACPRPGRIPRVAMRPVGNWMFFLTLGGAVAGFPLFLWLDPLALMSGTLSGWRGIGTLAGAAAAIGLPALLVLEWLQPRLWCGRICPLGGMQDVAAGLRRRRGRKRDGAGEERGRAAKLDLGRRSVLGFGAGLAAVWGGRALGAGKRETVIRPPGAAEEDQFGGLCVRCGSCVAACPSRILRPDPGKAGLGGWLAPVADFSDDYCREDCARCVAVCPSGALERLSAEQKRRWVMGVARLDLDLCLLAAGGECTACITRCPYGALSVGSSDGGFSSEPVLDKDLCTGCGACEVYCPAEPQKAIVVVAAVVERAS